MNANVVTDFSTSFKEPRGVVVAYIVDAYLLRGDFPLETTIEYLVEGIMNPYVILMVIWWVVLVNVEKSNVFTTAAF